MLKAGNRIHLTMQEHLTDQIQINQTALEKLNHTDLERATLIAKKHLNRRLGKKIKQPIMDAWTEEIIQKINSKRPTPLVTTSRNQIHPYSL